MEYERGNFFVSEVAISPSSVMWTANETEMRAAAFEVAISRLIGKLQEVISILPRELQTRRPMALSILQNRVYVSSSLGVNQLQICAQVENIMNMFLVKALMPPKSWRGLIAAALHGGVQLAPAPLKIRVPTSRVKAARNLVQKVEELSQHIETMQGNKLFGEFHETCKGNSSSNENRTSQANLFDELAIVGQEDAANRFIVQLTDSECLRVVSVVGNEGIGKTTLVRSVYNRLDTKHRFACQAWICNFNQHSLESVVVDILKQSPLNAFKDLERMEIDDLGEMLHKLLMELRYLIVLDDLKSPPLLNKLLCFLPDSRNGSRVILTCRDVDSVPLPQEPWGFHLPVEQLDNENSRKLLRERSSINNDGLIEKILCKCNGSPLKILLFGGLTAPFEPSDPECPPTAWACEVEDDHQQPDVRFLSFKSLPSWVKPCLLYLCLFPKESEISTRRIFQLWHAEGLVHCDQGHSTAEDCFQKLVDWNLLQVVSRRDMDKTAKTCRLSGPLHDYFTELAIQLEHLHDHQNDEREEVLWPSRPTSVLPWLARYSSNNTSPPLQDAETASRISSYISFNTQKSGIRSIEVEQLLKPLAASRDSMLLRVLDLEGVYKPKLPNQFGIMLPNLRYLGLRWTILDSLPESVSKLSRLETLDLKHTNVTKLPSSILHLKYVRHLYLNELSFDNCKPTKSCISNIQTLWGLSIGVKSSFLCVLERLKRLRKLGLTCDARVIPQATKIISTMTMLESLRLQSRDRFRQPSDLKTNVNMGNLRILTKLYLLGGLNEESLSCFLVNVRVLTLSFSEMNFDPMEALGKLQHLITLRLSANSYNGEAVVCRKGSFPSLRMLRLWKLEKLKILAVHEGAIPSLEELDIRDCKILRKIVCLKYSSKLKQIKLRQVSEDLAKYVESTLPNPAPMVTCTALNASAPKDKEEAAKIKQEDGALLRFFGFEENDRDEEEEEDWRSRNIEENDREEEEEVEEEKDGCSDNIDENNREEEEDGCSDNIEENNWEEEEEEDGCSDNIEEINWEEEEEEDGCSDNIEENNWEEEEEEDGCSDNIEVTREWERRRWRCRWRWIPVTRK